VILDTNVAVKQCLQTTQVHSCGCVVLFVARHLISLLTKCYGMTWLGL